MDERTLIPFALRIRFLALSLLFLPLSAQADPVIDSQLTDIFACGAKADWRLVYYNLAVAGQVEEERLGRFGYTCAVLNRPYEFKGLDIVELCGVLPKPTPLYVVTTNTFKEIEDAIGFMSDREIFVSSSGEFDCNPRG